MPLRLTQHARSQAAAARCFLRTAVDLMAEHVCAFKLQKAFYDMLPDGHQVWATD
jgi:hypothetical protein